jgi:Flp pilus assembly protein TadG
LRNRARGQSTVEVAAAFPLLILIGMAMLQFAIYYHAHNVVVAAVQEGAHVAASLGGTPEAGKDRANALIKAGLGPSLRKNLEVDLPETVRADQADEAVRMEVRGSMDSFIPWLGGPAKLPLGAVAEMSTERFRAPQ